MNINEIKNKLQSGGFDTTLNQLYTNADYQKTRYEAALSAYADIFGEGSDIRLFSAPGRTEIGGNHTDHQQGRVLAASVTLDVIAVAEPNGSNAVCIYSKGHNPDIVDITELDSRAGEQNTSTSRVRGVLNAFKERGYHIGGFNAYTTSDVLKGSGLSSSAAYEVLVGFILSGLFCGGSVSPVEIAKIGQYAENNYFGKPCGLMDQTASAVGGFVTIDFKDKENPVIEKLDIDFASSGYTLCIVDTKGSHADLTGEYAAIPQEMRAVAQVLGGEVLRDVPKEYFFENIGKLRGRVNDRAILRAMHFYADNDRVTIQAQALKENRFEDFLKLVTQSGRSSYMYNQNIYPAGSLDQGVAVALSVSEALLGERGGYRVHGGGFAGTIQAFVPAGMTIAYKQSMERLFGEGCCHVLSIRPIGGTEII